MDVKRQHLGFAKTETLWSSQAMQDARYNLDQYKRDLTQGNRVLAGMHLQEARWDSQWANKRLRLAAHQRRLSR